MKTLTILMEVSDENAEQGFRDMLEACSDELISSDLETLTIRIGEPKD